MQWNWDQIAPYFDELTHRTITSESVESWLDDWSKLSRLISEAGERLHVANTQNTADTAVEQRYNAFLENILPNMLAAEQKLKQKMVESGLQPPNFAIPMRNMRAEVELFREANLPLITQERKLVSDYEKIIGAQTIPWDGQEKTVAQMRPLLQNTDRDLRERVFRLISARQLADRPALGELWGKFLKLRCEMAANTGFGDYRSLRWKQLLRFDYTPEDSKRFHAAIEQVVVPAASRLFEKRRRQLGVDTLRPWDLAVDPTGLPPLRPYNDTAEFESITESMFVRVDPKLGGYFHDMRDNALLDLGNRKNKAPGGYCTGFAYSHKPFIFMNGVNIQGDVITLLHEGGHAFHGYETANLRYFHQEQIPMEFAEVASMSMELLASPYLAKKNGGFYSEADAIRARVNHLESIIEFWPYMAIVDAFQHWVYENPDAAADPTACDEAYKRLWLRFRPDVDFSGLEDVMVLRWQTQLHVFLDPFYYVEYGLAQLGAVQVWANSLKDQADAVARYRAALALGGTVPLPELYQAAGAKLSFEAEALQNAVDLIERTLADLEKATS
jgi:oligoendopeptidase F